MGSYVKTTDKLKPCPTCGRASTVITTDDTVVPEHKAFRVVCSCKLGGCGTSAGHRYTVKDAVDLWNTRAERTCQVKHRRLLDHAHMWLCSECGKLSITLYDSPAYCEWCGARVDDRKEAER